MIIVFSILAVLLIGQLICTFYLVSRYASSPEKVWKDKVLRSLEGIESARKKEQFSHDTMSCSERQEIDRLESQAINRLLQQMPVTLLADFPGIGPSTVEKLQYAGFSTIFDIHTRGINIHGIGDKRLSDINVAENQLCQHALARLKNADSLEARQLAQAIKAIQEAYSEKTLISEARLHAIGKVRELMHEAVAAARQISFWGYLKGTNRSLLPERLRNFGFPNLAATLEKAETKARSKSEGKPETPKRVIAPPPKVSPAPVAPSKPAPTSIPLVPPTVVPTPAPSRSNPKPAAPPPVMEQRVRAPLQFLDQQSKPPLPVIDPFAELLHAPAPSKPPTPLPVNVALFEPVDLAQELLEITVELGYLIARADGRLSQTEQQFIDDYLDHRYRSDAAMHTKARTLSAHCAKASIPIGPLIERIRKHCPREAMMHLLDFAKDVALAGNLNDKKHQCYHDVGIRLGLTLPALNAQRVEEPAPVPPPPRVEVKLPPLKPAAPSLVDQQRQTLEIDPGVPLSADLVRRQFNKLSDRFQSAKVAHLGAEFTKLAEERFAAAKVAAEALLATMGEELIIPTMPAEPVGLRENKELDELFGG